LFYSGVERKKGSIKTPLVCNLLIFKG